MEGCSLSGYHGHRLGSVLVSVEFQGNNVIPSINVTERGVGELAGFRTVKVDRCVCGHRGNFDAPGRWGNDSNLCLVDCCDVLPLHTQCVEVVGAGVEGRKGSGRNVHRRCGIRARAPVAFYDGNAGVLIVGDIRGIGVTGECIFGQKTPSGDRLQDGDYVGRRGREWLICKFCSIDIYLKAVCCVVLDQGVGDLVHVDAFAEGDCYVFILEVRVVSRPGDRGVPVKDEDRHGSKDVHRLAGAVILYRREEVGSGFGLRDIVEVVCVEFIRAEVEVCEIDPVSVQRVAQAILIRGEIERIIEPGGIRSLDTEVKNATPGKEIPFLICSVEELGEVGVFI